MGPHETGLEDQESREPVKRSSAGHGGSRGPSRTAGILHVIPKSTRGLFRDGVFVTATLAIIASLVGQSDIILTTPNCKTCRIEKSVVEFGKDPAAQDAAPNRLMGAIRYDRRGDLDREWTARLASVREKYFHCASSPPGRAGENDAGEANQELVRFELREVTRRQAPNFAPCQHDHTGSCNGSGFSVYAL
jgi:hypothetical protein